MNNFYCLYNSKSDSHDLHERISALNNSCVKRGVNFHAINQQNANFSSLPVPDSEDGLYNCARGSRLLECSMINKNVRTLYRKFPGTSVFRDPNQINIIFDKYNIPTPKTIHYCNNNKELLKSYVDYLGGFPIILKTYGGSGGIGTIQLDSFQGLFSTADYLFKLDIDFLLKEFIYSESVDRYTVIDEIVFPGYCRLLDNPNEFRSNAVNGKVVIKKNIPQSIKDILILAVKRANLYMAGVDIVIDRKTKEPKVLEVNLPANFWREGLKSEINIYDDMIDFFIKHPSLKETH
ncbi:MAG: hypothetical protein COA32_03755 [Fluviicola sp.]|nr:MAG: hypothetical protein COA32_03755 [Fluviicola sp.]